MIAIYKGKRSCHVWVEDVDGAMKKATEYKCGVKWSIARTDFDMIVSVLEPRGEDIENLDEIMAKFDLYPLEILSGVS